MGNEFRHIGLAAAAAALFTTPTGHGYLADDVLDWYRPRATHRPKDKPSGPTKKRAKVKAARKANLKRTRS